MSFSTLDYKRDGTTQYFWTWCYVFLPLLFQGEAGLPSIWTPGAGRLVRSEAGSGKGIRERGFPTISDPTLLNLYRLDICRLWFWRSSSKQCWKDSIMETVIKICRTSFLGSALVRTESFLCHMRERWYSLLRRALLKRSNTKNPWNFSKRIRQYLNCLWLSKKLRG